MSFVKDDHSFTRGVGAVAAMDAVSPRRRLAAAQAARKMARRDAIMSMRTLGALSFPTGPSTGVPGSHSIDVGPQDPHYGGGLPIPGGYGPRGGGGGGPRGGGGSGGRGRGGIVIPGGLTHPTPGTKLPGSVVTTGGGTTTQTDGGGTTTSGGGSSSGGSSGGGSSGGGGSSVNPNENIAAGDSCVSAGGNWDGTTCSMVTTEADPTLVLAQQQAAALAKKKMLLLGALGAGALWYFFLRGK